MNHGALDRLTVQLSRLVTRRATVGALGTLVAPSLVDAKSRKRKNKKTCKKCGLCATCKKGRCKPKPVGTSCGTGRQCFDKGKCVACDVCASGCPHETLAAAIAAASDGATIHICSGTYPTKVTIAKAVTVIGVGEGTGGTVLQGQGKGDEDHVLRIYSPGVVELRDLRITGGHAVSGGGMQFAGGGTTALIGCTITENTADSGGGLYREGDGPVTLTRCTISGNSATSGGGGIYNNFFGSHPLTLVDCLITGNRADWGSDGGGIYNDDGAVVLTNGSRVTGNTADGDGGGIYNDDGDIQLRSGSRVTGNTPDDCFGTDAC